MSRQLLGYCKECVTDVYEDDNLDPAGHPDVYECRNCGYPNSMNDLWKYEPKHNTQGVKDES